MLIFWSESPQREIELDGKILIAAKPASVVGRFLISLLINVHLADRFDTNELLHAYASAIIFIKV
jgi:hypothetical protein